MHTVSSGPGPRMSPTQALRAGFVLQPARERAAEAPRAADTERPRQGFCVGTLGLMLPYEDSSELTDPPVLHRLPHAPSWLHGVANLHGDLVPVFDLAGYCGIECPASSKRMLLVLSRGADAAGVLIDGLPVRLKWDGRSHADIGTAPSRLAAHTRAAALIDGRLWLELDARSLLDTLAQAH